MLVNATNPVFIQPIFRAELLRNRQLDKGSTTRDGITTDFNRFGIDLNPLVLAADRRNIARYRRLQTMNAWRNAVAHQDFSRLAINGVSPTLRLATVREWRAACSGLALSFDRVMREPLRVVTGNAPC